MTSSKPRIGSLCSGYGGLDLAVESLFDAEVAWYSEFDKHPSAIMAHHYPALTNYGDLTKIDWEMMPPIDILTAGYPCQPFSQAGQRKGTNDPRHIWPNIAEAIRVLRPSIAIFENVRGHLTLGFDTVLGQIADLGYDAQWSIVRAAEVGAPHRRERLFIVAYPQSTRRGTQQNRLGAGQSPSGNGMGIEHQPNIGIAPNSDNGEPIGTMQESWWGFTSRTQMRMPEERTQVAPNSNCTRPERCENTSCETQADCQRHCASGITPFDDSNASGIGCLGAGVRQKWHQGESQSGIGDMGAFDWKQYEPAIRKWEYAIQRSAPEPIDNQRLNPRFVEWMMGLPDGWVTDIDIPYNAQIKALGNGVVPQQAYHAIKGLVQRI